MKPTSHFLPQSSVSQITFKSSIAAKDQMTDHLVESSIISIDSNVTDNIIMKVINIQQEKHKTKNEALRNSSVSKIFLWRLPNEKPLEAVYYWK